MRGRHTRYSPELGRRICAAVAQGQSLTRLSLEAGMPGRCTIAKWRKRHPEFRHAYDAAVLAGRGRKPEPRKARPAAIARRRGYSARVGDAICERIGAGRSLLHLARDRDLPSTRTIYTWLAEHPDFCARYQSACALREERLADEVLAIADGLPLSDDPEAGPEPHQSDLNRAKLMIDARKWRLGILTAGKYGARAPAAPIKTHEDWLDELDDEDQGRGP